MPNQCLEKRKRSTHKLQSGNLHRILPTECCKAFYRELYDPMYVHLKVSLKLNHEDMKSVSCYCTPTKRQG